MGLYCLRSMVHNQGDDSVLMRLKIVASFMIVLMVLIMVPRPTQSAQFVIAGWEYDDGYGQGIELLWAYENSTSSWVAIFDPAFVFWYEGASIELNWTPNTALKIIATANINHTLFAFGPDKSENASARAIMRVGIEVFVLNEIVFSQDNMAWEGSVFNDTDTTWAISYEAVINVILVPATTYVVLCTYEIYAAV